MATALPPSVVDIPAAAIEAMRKGRKIDAIKATRQATGLGLKEAKEAVEAFIERSPDVRQEYLTATASAHNTLWLVLAVLVAVGFAAYAAIALR
jgi:Ribosomal protein L7/L12 C-terminal domain